jgi:hypothetical protein
MKFAILCLIAALTLAACTSKPVPPKPDPGENAATPGVNTTPTPVAETPTTPHTNSDVSGFGTAYILIIPGKPDSPIQPNLTPVERTSLDQAVKTSLASGNGSAAHVHARQGANGLVFSADANPSHAAPAGAELQIKSSQETKSVHLILDQATLNAIKNHQ